MPEPKPEDLILIGAIAGAFGVRGEVKVRTFTAAPENIAAYGPLYDKTGRVALTPKSWRPITDALAITAPEVKTREAAEALRNTALYVPRALLPEPDDDEFYHVDLIGCRVEALDGERLGVVKAVQNFGAGDLLEITLPDGKTWFLPFTKDAAPIVEVGAKRVVSAQAPPSANEADTADNEGDETP